MGIFCFKRIPSHSLFFIWRLFNRRKSPSPGCSPHPNWTKTRYYPDREVEAWFRTILNLYFWPPAARSKIEELYCNTQQNWSALLQHTEAIYHLFAGGPLRLARCGPGCCSSRLRLRLPSSRYRGFRAARPEMAVIAAPTCSIWLVGELRLEWIHSKLEWVHSRLEGIHSMLREDWNEIILAWNKFIPIS